MDRRDRLEKFNRLVDRHVQHVVNTLTFVLDFERFTIVTLPVTHLALYIDIGQEIHFDRLNPRSPARFTPPALDVERETSCFETANLCVGRRFEQFPDIAEHVGIGRRIARGVRPIGDWSTTTSLSIFAIPSIASCSSG